MQIPHQNRVHAIRENKKQRLSEMRSTNTHDLGMRVELPRFFRPYFIYAGVCATVSAAGMTGNTVARLNFAILLHPAKGQKTYGKNTQSRCKITDSIRDLVNICIFAGDLGGGDPERRDQHVKGMGR